MPVSIDKMKAVFLAASEKATAAERAAFLDDACGDDAALRHEVEAMLRAHDQADPLLDRPAAEPLESPPPPDGRVTQDKALGFLDPPARPGSLGRLGHYEVLEVLGRGGFGIVLRAVDDTLQRVVAVKVLAHELAATSPARKRFVREARASAMIRHENVVRVYAVEEQPLPYLVMEFIPGETLQQRLDRTGPLDAAEVVRIGRQVAEGLAAAHARGLIHRDIKPGNILIEDGPQQCVKITDFGLARAADDASMTQSGLLAGTPMYMAPEQAHGDRLDHRADLFSLGSVLYTMCSGRPPFRASGPLAVLKRVAEDAPRPIPEIIPEVPRWLCDVVARLHAKRPDDRFSTAREVADLLAAHPSGTPHPANALRGPDAAPASGKIPVRPAPHAAAAGRPPRFRSRGWAAAAAVLLMLAGGLGLTEATGVTRVRGTVVRLFSPAGTLVVEVDDPGVSVQVDGSDLVIAGAGAREIRLKPGTYTVEARKGGAVVSRELVAVTSSGRQVARVSQEPPPPDAKTATGSAGASDWERAVAAMPADEQVAAVAARLTELNPGFDGRVMPTITDGVVTGLQFLTEEVTDVAPVRALTKLSALDCGGWPAAKGRVSDLSPLRGMRLTSLGLSGTRVRNLEPLQGMPLNTLDLYVCRQVSDLSPLRGMPLADLVLGSTQVRDLAPLRGMPLTSLNLFGCPARDWSPLNGMLLTRLVLGGTEVQDLAVLRGMPLTSLHLWGCVNVRDLAPLTGMPLTSLHIGRTGVTDLRPLHGMPLEEVFVAPRNITQGLGALRDMKSVRAIGVDDDSQARPAAEFWARYDGGEFKK